MFIRILTNVTIILFLIFPEVKALDTITIGAGPPTGLYYHIGGALAKLINKKQKIYNMNAIVTSTNGSASNINALLKNKIDFGFTQADALEHAYNGTVEWKNIGPQKNLRAVLVLHDEAITLIASEKSGIKTVTDLKDKRVDLGPKDSGQIQNALDILSAYGLTINDIKAQYIKMIEAPVMLINGNIDAFFLTAGHPNANVQEAASGRNKIIIVPLDENVINNLTNKYSYYSRMEIPVSYYFGVLNKSDVPAIGVKSLIVTSTAIDEKKVYIFTKVIFESLDYLKKLHPSLNNITKENMTKNIDIPLHKGALKYYKEVQESSLLE